MSRLFFLRGLRWCTVAVGVAWLSGCATAPAAPNDAAFRAARPASILVLPPINHSLDIVATASVLSHSTQPLAEAGYYVLPVTLVTETFRQNGVEMPVDTHEAAPAKLREIFGADAALYITITQYGVRYQLIDSVATVSAEARLMDLRTGTELWTGRASAASNEGNNQSSGGIAGMLITALIKQVMNSVTDATYPVAGVSTQRLLAAGKPGGWLYGPRSPHFQKP
jgi:hypothetical protein